MSAAISSPRRPWAPFVLGALPFAAVVGLWWAAPHVLSYPPYVMPSVGEVFARLWEITASGQLAREVGASLARLLLAFAVGNLLAIPLGILIAMNAHAARTILPVTVFFQSIAGIAWAPLAVLWFGIGNAAVVFLVVNSVFFASIYNAISGVQSIPPVLWRAVRSLGASRGQVLAELVIPGAVVQILVGLRTSMALGWRALVAAELIIGTNGLGFMMMDATKWYGTDTVICGIIVIGVLWLLFDRLVFKELERVTARRWGMLADA